MQDRLNRLTEAKISQKQAKWFEKNFYAFIHFGMNTFTDREWGDGEESPSLFNPKNFKPRQWAKVIKDIGMRGLILTCKHHDGFCLWPTETTEHSIVNSPYKNGQGDIVAEVVSACRDYDLEFGFYLSPWDRHASCYGSEEYNDYYCRQLEELLTNYGDIFMVWFDGACAEGPNGKVQNYDFARYVELIRKYQREAVIFSDMGPDVHWIGNEAGKSRYAEWSVIPAELACLHDEVRNSQVGKSSLENHNLKKSLSEANDNGRDFSFYYFNDAEPNLGSLDMMLHSKQAVFCPSETDFSIRPGWFYHENEEPHSVERLFEVYLHSVGNNSALNLNIPPNRDGLLDKRDITRLYEFKEKIDCEFSKLALIDRDYTLEEIRNGIGAYQAGYKIDIKGKNSLAYIVLCEDLNYSQRIVSFDIETKAENGDYYPIYRGTTVGNKKIIKLNACKSDSLRILIKLSRGEVKLKTIELYFV